MQAPQMLPEQLLQQVGVISCTGCDSFYFCGGGCLPSCHNATVEREKESKKARKHTRESARERERKRKCAHHAKRDRQRKKMQSTLVYIDILRERRNKDRQQARQSAV